MSPKDYYRNRSKNMKNALYDKQMNHCDYRVYCHIAIMQDIGVYWQQMTFKEIGEGLGQMDRSTISKSFRKLHKLKYLKLCGSE